MTLTATVAQTETTGSSESNAPTADGLDFFARSLDMDWAQGDMVASEPHVKAFIHVIGFASLLSAGLWGALFLLIQLI